MPSGSVWIFGYGSLVNDATWAQPAPFYKARLTGWIRQWRHHNPGWDGCALTVERRAGVALEGVLFPLPEDALPALDRREQGYIRVDVSDQIVTGGEGIPYAPGDKVYMYVSGEESFRWADERWPLAHSYIDCVLEGFERHYGEQGVRRFFETTEGWHLTRVNDRRAHRYPRGRSVAAEVLALIDRHLAFVEKEGLRPGL